MAVALKQENVITEIGHYGVVHSWFSTVATRLEDSKWGSKFPTVMLSLHQGKLRNDQGKAALLELKSIAESLSKLSTSELVWDAEDHAKRPPPEHQKNPKATSLVNYFLTANGLDLTQEFIGNVESMIEFGGDLEIISVNLPPPRR
ncbi:MAG: hypothetical protein EOO15_23615 [Chitinophagaceae bacterium]|nr:MAG: hypothetical protein EOO15_23615 [Chitinophagaceae bacterium]